MLVECNYVCNPANNMAQSCISRCPGFTFTMPTPVTTSVLDADKKHSDQLAVMLIITFFIAVLTVALGVLLWCCRNKLKKLMRTIKFQYLKYSIEETVTNETPTREETVSKHFGSLVKQEHVENIIKFTDEKCSFLQQASGESVHIDSTEEI